MGDGRKAAKVHAGTYLRGLLYSLALELSNPMSISLSSSVQSYGSFMFLFLESYVFILRVLWETHPQATERTNEANNAFKHKGRSRLMLEAEIPGGQHILILMHFRVCSYASLLGFLVLIIKIVHIGLMNRRVLCLCFLWGL